jgi:DNA mismatch repair protein MutS
MGDFYELFFEDAKKLAPILDLKLTTRGTDHKNEPIPLAGIPVKSLNDYLKKVISHNISVAVVEQEERPIKVKGKEFFPREVKRVITPGTILDPDLISEKKNNYLLIINSNSTDKEWGWSLCDVSTGEINIAKFSSYHELINEAIKHRPSEILLNMGLKDNQEFNDYLKKIFQDMDFSFLDSNLFDLDSSINNLHSYFNVQSLEGFGINVNEHAIGIEAAGALINMLRHRKIPLISSKIEVYSNQTYMEIDPIAWKNMEIDQNLREGKVHGTLLSILDETQTPMGARTLRSWLRRPLLDIAQINNRLNVVELFLREFTLRDEIQECFRQITDLERISTKILYKGASPRDLKRLEESLSLLPKIRELLSSIKLSPSMKLMEDIISNIIEVPEAVKLISSSIKEDSNNIQDGDVIKDNYDFELDKLRNLKRNSTQYILELEKKEQQLINERARKKGTKEPKLKIAYTRGHGYYIELRNNVDPPPEYSIARSLKDRTRYTTPELLELANKLLTAEEDIRNLELELYKGILTELEKYIPAIKQVSQYIGELDVLLTFSHISNAFKYIRPELSNEIIHRIKNGRHPIIEQILNLGEFIPNDTLLDGNDNLLLIISGANMGGKSTYLRQVALITILAQIGCFVPADYALIGIVDRIFTRVGIVDDIWKGQSHFMIEMVETANILNNATNKSLVLLDELGRGTSTNTGLAIAWAVSKYLQEKVKCRTLFATHYHQLNEMENRYVGIKNYHVSVFYNSSTNQLKFLRKVEPGGTDESYGLEVAELAGFPNSVINEARRTRKLINSEKFFTTKSDNEPAQKEISGLDQSHSYSKNKTRTKKSLLTYFGQNKSEIEEIIEDLDLESITPIEALNLLHQLKKKLK